jgi:TrmH family RNA methyltransferase
MANFGFSHLRVVNPHQLAFQEARSAVGASAILAKAKEFSTVAEAVADCHLVVGTASMSRREPLHPVNCLAKGAVLVRKRLSSKNCVALLFGSEKRGLCNQDLSHCHWLVRIPTLDNQPSMNLGQAVAVCLYEITRGVRFTSASEKPVPATSAELERVTRLLMQALFASGYLKTASSSQSQRTAAPPGEKIRRLTRRLKLSGADAELLLGILRQILWKLGPHDPGR